MLVVDETAPLHFVCTSHCGDIDEIRAHSQVLNAELFHHTACCMCTMCVCGYVDVLYLDLEMYIVYVATGTRETSTETCTTFL